MPGNEDHVRKIRLDNARSNLPLWSELHRHSSTGAHTPQAWPRTARQDLVQRYFGRSPSPVSRVFYRNHNKLCFFSWFHITFIFSSHELPGINGRTGRLVFTKDFICSSTTSVPSTRMLFDDRCVRSASSSLATHVQMLSTIVWLSSQAAMFKLQHEKDKVTVNSMSSSTNHFNDNESWDEHVLGRVYSYLMSISDNFHTRNDEYPTFTHTGGLFHHNQGWESDLLSIESTSTKAQRIRLKRDVIMQAYCKTNRDIAVQPDYVRV